MKQGPMKAKVNFKEKIDIDKRNILLDHILTVFNFLKYSMLNPILRFALPIVLVSFLYGCAAQSLDTPCPDYGRYCKKTPVNSWDYKGLN